MDKKEGRHSIRIIVRMTENEYEKFDTLYKKVRPREGVGERYEVS